MISIINDEMNRDDKQAEVLLSSQEHLLSKDETPANLEQAETLMKKHEALLTTMDANDDKVNGVLLFADRLLQDEHFAADKISNNMVNNLENADRTSIIDSKNEIGTSTFPESLGRVFNTLGVDSAGLLIEVAETSSVIIGLGSRAGLVINKEIL